MTEPLRSGVQGFEQAEAFARTFRFEITEEYRALIARVEAMPSNQAGTDKSGRWRGGLADRMTFVGAFSLMQRE